MSEELKLQLSEHFKKASSSPFLFIGSGFSRRYLNLDDWRGLLEKLSEDLKPFEYYLSSADGDLPVVASLMAEDFHDYWWSEKKYEDQRKKFKSRITSKTSALRIAIAEYLKPLSDSAFGNPEYHEEINALSKLNVDGVITTNWDSFIEQIFPDYKVYIGQNELLFSNPQSVGEIYKIHGCITKPNSLILTNEDYDEFNNKNPYLAAKLITLFVEHPIVFIGYRIGDPNIIALLRSIVMCLGEDKIEKLGENLIFVQRRKNAAEAAYSRTIMPIEGFQIPFTVVKTDSFTPVYQAIEETKRKIPARVLRYCKEQLYELVKSSDPGQKICVVGLDDVEKSQDIEFVVGIGVAEEQKQQVTNKGYAPYSSMDLFHNLIFDEVKVDCGQILNVTIPELEKRTKYLPVFKCLSEADVTSQSDYQQSEFHLDKMVDCNLSQYRTTAHLRSFIKNAKDQTLSEIIKSYPPEKASLYIPFLKPDEIDLDELRVFLSTNFEKFDSEVSTYSSYFRKLACFYDRLKYGWLIQ
jgi:hypothetical protein